MPRIESGGPINPKISSRVDAYTSNASPQAGVAQGQQQLGAQITQIGLGIADRVKKTQDNDFAFNSAVEDHGKISSFAADDIIKNGADGHAERVSAMANKLRDARIENAPSSQAANIYDKHTANIFMDANFTAQQKQTSGIAEKSRSDLKNQSDTTQRSILQNPDPKLFYEGQNLFNQRVDSAVESGTIAVDQAEKIKQQHGNLSSKAVFDGLLAKGDAGLGTGMKLLKDKSLTDNLTPDELDRIQKSFKNNLDMRDRQQFSEAKAFMGDAIADIAAGNKADSKQVAYAMGILSRGKQTNPFEVARIQNELKVATAVNEGISQIRTKPMSEWGDLRDQTLAEIRGKDKTWGAKEELHYQQLFNSQLNNIAKAVEKDAHGFAVSSNPELKQLAAAAGSDPAKNRQLQEKSLQYQEYMGIAPENRKVASPQEADQWGLAIKATKNADQAGQVIAQIQQRYGPRAPMFMHQLVHENKDLAGIEIGAYFDGAARTLVADNVMNGKTYKEEFKADPELASETKNLETIANKKMESIRLSLVAGNNEGSKVEMAHNFREVLLTDVMRRKARGSNKSIDELVDDSYKQLFDHFDTISIGKSNVLVSKGAYGAAGSKETSEKWMDWASGPGIQSLDAKMPEYYKQDFVKGYGQTEGMTRAQSNWNSVLKDNHRWVTNQTQDGIYLTFDDGIHTAVPLTASNGKPIEKKFKDMNRMEIDTQQEQMKSFANSAKTKSPLGSFGGF